MVDKNIMISILKKSGTVNVHSYTLDNNYYVGGFAFTYIDNNGLHFFGKIKSGVHPTKYGVYEELFDLFKEKVWRELKKVERNVLGKQKK